MSEKDSESEHKILLGLRNSINKPSQESLKTESDLFNDELEYLPFECHPEYLDMTRHKNWRFIMLPLICLFVMGNYYSYDEPAAVELQMETYFNFSKT